MKQAYRRAMEHIRLSPPARENIQSALERPRHRRRLERPALIAAAAAVVLTVSAAAAAMQMVFFHNLPEDVAETMQPVNRSITRSGITLTVQSASVEDGRFRAYITLKDEEGDRLSEDAIDMSCCEVYNLTQEEWGFDEIPIRAADSFHAYYSGFIPCVRAGSLSYDEESDTYGFLLEVYDAGGRPLPFPNSHFMVHVSGLEIEGEIMEAVFYPQWPDASQEAKRAHVDLRRVNAQLGGNPPDWLKEGVDLLVPGETGLQMTENHDISAIGWVDGKLHIQERYSGMKKKSIYDASFDVEWHPTADFSVISLVRPDGSRVEIELLCSFFDQENYYRECVYAISPEALAECALGGSYETGRQYVEGLWRVHFSLDETE